MLDESVTHYNIIEFDELAEMDQIAEFSTIEIEYADVEDFELDEFDADELKTVDTPPGSMQLASMSSNSSGSSSCRVP